MDRIAVSLALLLLVALVVAPVGAMAIQSVRADYVETADGKTLLGQIKDRDERGIVFRVEGEEESRHLAASEVRDAGRRFSLLHYRGVLTGRGERNMLLATLTLACASALLAFLIGLPAGLLLAATDLPGRRLLEPLTALPLVLPPILFAIATYHDLIGTEPAFLRAVFVFGLCLFPLVSLFTARAVRAAGADALAAARLATTPREALLRVALGPALPGATAGALLAFSFVVADFAVPDFLGVTTAQNTITVYANAVFNYWMWDRDAGAATAAGMPATLLCLIAFALVLRVESRRAAAAAGGDDREPDPVPLGRGRYVALAFLLGVLLLALVWPMSGHVRTARGDHFGEEVATAGARSQVKGDDSRARPKSFADGLRKGLTHNGVGQSARNSVLLAGGGALLALLLALLLTEAGRHRPRLDRALLLASFLPVAVPPMTLAVGWVSLFGSERVEMKYFPMLLLAGRLLPFATFAVRSARARLAPELLDAAAVAGLPPASRALRVTFPLLLPGAALGFLLAFLFGLREVDALVFARGGTETLPFQLYGMIHYGYDVQVAGLAFLWTAGVALFLLAAAFLVGRRFRLMP